MRIIIFTLVVFGMVLIPSSRAEEPMSLTDLEEELLERNPRIKAAINMAEAAHHAVTPASWLEDPIFGYGYFGEGVQTRVGPQKQLFQLSQKIPLGKLSLKEKMAGLQASALDEVVAAVTWEVLTELKKAYFDLWWADRALRTTDEEMEVIGALEEIARVKYGAGRAGQQDVLKSQLELSRLQDRRLQYARQRDTLVVLINRLLDRPTAAPLGEPEEVEGAAVELSLDSLQKTAEEHNPTLKMARREEEGAALEVTLARRQNVPDLTLGATYFDIGSGETTSPDDGTDAWMVSAGINLPLWFWRNRSTVRGAASRLGSARENMREKENLVHFQVSDRFFSQKTAGEQVKIYKDSLLPQARQAYEASRAGYESGTVDFLNLLDGQRALLEIRLAYLRSITDYHKSMAELEEAVGKPLINDEIRNPNDPPSLKLRRTGD